MSTNERKEYQVQFDDAAPRDIKKLSKQAQVQIIDLASSLAKNPRPEGVETLKAHKGCYRVRTGNYRIVYTIEDDQLIVLIVAVGDRKNIYEIMERRFD